MFLVCCYLFSHSYQYLQNYKIMSGNSIWINIHYEKKNECGIFEKEGLFGKRGTKRGPLLAIFLKKSLRGTKNPKRDRLVITAKWVQLADYRISGIRKRWRCLSDIKSQLWPFLAPHPKFWTSNPRSTGQIEKKILQWNTSFLAEL